METEKLVQQLTDRNAKVACGAMRELEEQSAQSAVCSPYFDRFAALLSSKRSYERNRGLRLVAANAGWVDEQRLAAVLPEYLSHLEDEKPITVRQCIAGIQKIAAQRPQLRGQLCAALRAADGSGYGESMAPLIAADLARALQSMEP